MGKIDFAAQLSAAQFRAATHAKGPLRVVGGPGGGKTRVLTYRIAWMVREAGIEPENILALTFTNKAATEMKERLAALLGDDVKIAASTIHSWAYRFLCIYRGKNADGILGTWNPNAKSSILADARQYFAWQQSVQAAKVDVAPAFAMHTVSRAKNNGVSRAALRSNAAEASDHKVVRACDAWHEYEKWQERMKVIDFDDLLILANELLARPDIIKKVHDYHKVVLLDESQDTNLVQWGIVRKLAPPPKSELTVVGDYDQSIYGWRGAAAESFLEFVQDYRAETVKLETNYRSTSAIVDAANTLIERNGSREEKVLEAAGKPGTVPFVRVEPDAGVEASRGVEQVRRWLADYEAGEVAILVRAWWLTRSFEERLLKGRIPYRVVGGPAFFGRREVADLLAYVTLVVDPTRDAALQRILNVPNRFLGAAAWRAVERHALKREMPALAALSDPGLRWPKKYMRDRSMDLYVLLQRLRRFDGETRELIEEILAKTRYMAWLKEECEPEELRQRKDNIDEMLTAAEEHPDPADFVFYAEQLTPKKDDSEEGVVLTSIHGAKGLEFPCVIVAGCAEGILPHERCEDVEEERRLAYVAITRAERELMMTAATLYRNRGYTPSRFLEEAGLEVPEWEPVTGPPETTESVATV
ncbi:MAG: AAA family ATPase [Acidobacteria bacterium]|nr:AAA family ATPase [Acidobacteriota bacterium]